MSLFPAIVPASRDHTPASFPVTPHAATTGRERRIRHGNIPVDQSITVVLENVTEAEMLSIRAHYLEHEPLRRSFAIQTETVAGETLDWFSDPDYSWIYVGPIEFEDIRQDVHRVSVTLGRVPEPAPTGWTISGMAAALITTGQLTRLNYSRRLIGQAASFTTTGQTAQIGRTWAIIGGAASFITTGQTAQIGRTWAIIGGAASFVTTGQNATLTYP